MRPAPSRCSTLGPPREVIVGSIVSLQAKASPVAPIGSRLKGRQKAKLKSKRATLAPPPPGRFWIRRECSITDISNVPGQDLKILRLLGRCVYVCAAVLVRAVVGCANPFAAVSIHRSPRRRARCGTVRAPSTTTTSPLKMNTLTAQRGLGCSTRRRTSGGITSATRTTRRPSASSCLPERDLCRLCSIVGHPIGPRTKSRNRARARRYTVARRRFAAQSQSAPPICASG